MDLVQVNPTQIRISDLFVQRYPELKSMLSAVNLSTVHQLRKWQQAEQQEQRYPGSHWFVRKYGTEALEEQIARLAREAYKCFLFHDEAGYWTYAGYKTLIEEKFKVKVLDKVIAPVKKPITFKHLGHEPYDYQLEGVRRLIEARHGAVEFVTGSGKSLCIALAFQQIGLPGVVIAPTLSIAEQLYVNLVNLFGKDQVGRYYKGKKEGSKKFVVGVTNSLNLLTSDSTIFADKRVLIVDESHQCAIDSLESICMGVLGSCEYRFFFSGTQIRNDGMGILLDGIIGPVLMELTLKEAVQRGTVLPPKFFQCKMNSTMIHKKDEDPIKINRIHLQNNKDIYEKVAKLVDRAVTHMGRRVVILIDQLEQFKHLLKYVKHPMKLAHGNNMNKELKEFVPKEYHKNDNAQLVKEFDDGQYPVLVGTSAIGIGTDIRSVSFIIDLVGLKSEIRLRQAIGRGTRLWPGKTDFYYIDFAIQNVPMLRKHSEVRAKIMTEVFAAPKEISI